MVSGTPGDQLIVLQLPFGSFTPDQPAAPVVVTAALSNLADAGFALPIRVRGGFQYGNDALANPPTDPSIVGTFPAVGVAPAVTPTVLRLTKTYLGPEDETATGPNFPRQYRITVDVATGQIVTDLDVIDALPGNLQFVAVTNASAVGAPTVSAIATPSTTTPGGTLTRRFSSVTGTSGTTDATLEFSFFVPLRDVTSTEVIPPASGDDATSPNQAGTQGNWDPIDSRDAIAPVSAAGTAGAPEHTLTPKSLAIQKGVTVAIDTGVAGPSPGDTLQFTLDIQVSDFFALQTLVLTDVISDGQRHDGVAPQLSVVEHTGGNSAVAASGRCQLQFRRQRTQARRPRPSRCRQNSCCAALTAGWSAGASLRSAPGDRPPTARSSTAVRRPCASRIAPSSRTRSLTPTRRATRRWITATCSATRSRPTPTCSRADARRPRVR